jgi:predicted DNA-binding protein
MEFKLPAPTTADVHRKTSMKVRLNVEEAERLDALVARGGLTRSEVVRFLIDRSYAQLISDDGVSWPH